ncbi:glycoside hydrolase family 127 protein [Agathobacter sp.]
MDLKNIKIEDPFWGHMQQLVTDVVIPFQESVLHDEQPDVEKSHAIENFKIAAGLSEGEFYGMVFQDSDVAKWLEGVAYSLVIKPDADLEKRADEIIDIVAKAQQPDGYLNTYFTIKEPEHRWQNLLECHELYCAGHMMEAAVAYYQATGKDKLLKVMEGMAGHIIDRFGPDKITGIPGHQEVEIGLMRMYHVTGNEAYKKQARYFLEERGKNPDFFVEEAAKRDWKHFGMIPEDTKYNQSHATIYEQDEAVGHSVRAVYMYTAMADLAATEHDEKLFAACERLWNNMTQKKMYVTGGIGSTVEGEAFTKEYELPNDMAYAETCASIGLVFFAKQMLRMSKNGKYADAMERELYNGIISGMQLDGKRFFYVNPLEVNLGVSGEIFGYKHVIPERPGWYACACCPPNLVRMVTSLGKYAWDEEDDTIYSHLFIGQEAKLDKADIRVSGIYPWGGNVAYTVSPKTDEEFTLAIHIPGYLKKFKTTLNGKSFNTKNLVKDGYLYIERKWHNGDCIELTFDMDIRTIYANTNVREDIGCVALMRGPVVYCFEGVDNDGDVQSLLLDTAKISEASVTKVQDSVLQGATVLDVAAVRLESTDDLYSEQPPARKSVKARAIPYYMWGNRGLNQMRVWMHTV